MDCRPNDKTMFKCKKCGHVSPNSRGLSQHIILAHKLKYQEYFDTYVDTSEHLCECGKKLKFSKGRYLNTCGNKSCVVKVMKRTNTSKYGCECSLHCDEIHEKAVKTCLDKYGVECYASSKEFIEKGKESKRIRYGDENFNNREEASKTCLEKYGVDNYLKTEECKERIRLTNLERYGDECSCRNDSVKSKMKKTCIEKFGCFYTQTEEFKEKSKETCLNKYGFENFSQSDFYKSKRVYEYEGISFDSKAEIEVYKFCKDKKLNFSFHPCGIIYFDELNVQHTYHPDFEIEGKLYEIKGDHFFDENGKYRTPWKGKLTDDQLLLRQKRDDAKIKCMIENKVIIIKSSQIKNLEKILYFNNN